MGTNKNAFAPKKQSSKEKAPHILVIRLSALGDVAMTVPVLRTCVASYPQLRLTVLSRPFFKPLFANIPNLTFYEAQVKGKHKGIFGLWVLADELEKLQIDAVADLHNVLRSKILKFFLKRKGIPVIQIDKGRKEKKALTRKANKNFKPLKTTHQRYADVFKQLGFPIDLSQHRVPPKKEITPKILETIGTTDKKWIGIAPFAAFKGKMYPLDLMEQVIAALDNQNNVKIILFGGGRAEGDRLNTLFSSRKNVINAVGKFTFEEELILISNLKLMVSMDSGNAHLAAMLGIATITLWGVTHPFAGFYPFHQPMENALLANREHYPLIPTSIYGNSYPKNYEDAMRTISPKSVVEKIMENIK